MSRAQGYQPLSTDPLDNSAPAKATWTSKISRRVLVGVVVVETLALLAILALLVRTSQTCASAPVLYCTSKYSLAVENEVHVYDVGFSDGDPSPFQIPSSPELDKLWADLYDFGVSRITKDEAARLPNKTQAIPGDPGHYVVELEVFHNLHCLDRMRMALDPDYYPDYRMSISNTSSTSLKNRKHVLHCLDWIRQALMCNADTSVVVWQWDESRNTTRVKGNIAHTCRNFEKLQDWAKERILINEYDPTVNIEDDIVVPIIQKEFGR
ncbi:hypothetical protein MVEN_01615600 [Mycena venus]|uniref:Tat pathway signal sequence n=1 Tax=Mycena venus TaxID=2733690 RepID=A0A8H6XQ48_9AGAR|nr:hypothetical protein MVEN_01615600 [Mycena venus]